MVIFAMIYVIMWLCTSAYIMGSMPSLNMGGGTLSLLGLICGFMWWLTLPIMGYVHRRDARAKRNTAAYAA